jgi:cytochrome c oxidase subunit III
MTQFADHPRLDVSHLPEWGFGSCSPLWWGNNILLAIETTMFALLAASYFYLRQNFTEWPPVQSNINPPLYHPLPDLWASTSVLAVMLVGCTTIGLAHWAALRFRPTPVRIGMIVSFLLGALVIVLRFYEFSTLHFRWDDNAYGSITWMILGMHLFHLIVLTLEIAVVGVYVVIYHPYPKRALDVTTVANYWYWVAAMWVVFYLIVYWSPRWYQAPPP